ncbi:hypothetical protein ACQZ4Y_19530 [Rhizobium sp. L80/93]|uniref:hypothetical protein n=1 Tax=Rhizobium sp. E27B/91 TaxID=2819995 RepID=UPI001ADA28B2|nr:hypothetical protein [Rhizobium sp. E27B/91]MBO9186483.1 hypothetical protein [Rhizobium sp. E27B/91]
MQSLALFCRPSARLVCCYYLAAIVMIAFVIPRVQFEPDAWNMTLHRLIETGVGWSDPTSFATAARDLYETGWIRIENAWIFNLWPPGLPMIEAAVLSVFGRDAPLLFILQIAAVILHTAVAVAFYFILRKYANGVIAFFGAMLPFAFPVTRVYLLQPTGVAFGETFAVGFFFLGMLASFDAISQPSYPRATMAGIALSLSAYIRSQFELILMMQALVAVALLLLAVTGVLRRITAQPVDVAKLLCVFIIVTSAQAALVPWRVHNLVQRGTAQWVATSSLTARNSVMADADLSAIGGNFVVLGGGNVACKVAPQTCGNLDHAESLFIRTFIHYPIEWLSYKASLMPKYWFAPMGNWVMVKNEARLSDIIYNSILAFIIAIGFVMILTLKSLKRHETWIALVLFNFTLLLSYAAISAFVQFEARYLYFPKVAGIMLFLIEIAILGSSRSAKIRKPNSGMTGG